MSEVQAILCGDRNVLVGMAVAGRSALEHCSRPLVLNVLGTGLAEDDKDRLRRSWQHPMLAEARFLNVEHEEVRSFRSTAYLKSKAAYSRYYLARVADARRLIYLDTDLIVLRDLAEADDLDLGSKAIGAVRDISARLQPEDPARKTRLGLAGTADYFNSGFLIIDMDAWRQRDAERRLLDISVSMFDRLDSQDQDALNVVFEHDTHLLDVHWNLSQYEASSDVTDAVLHLIGSVKPWHPDYTYKFADLFFSYVDRTAYAGFRPSTGSGLAVFAKKVSRRIPTLDMIVGKVRRSIA